MILPFQHSMILRSDAHRVDFPLPVRPTIPIFSPEFTSNDIPFKTSGDVGEYRIHRLSTTIPVVDEGQYAGGRASVTMSGASC